MDSFLIDQNIFAICLSEHWLKEEETKLAAPDGYSCVSAFCRSSHIRGGSLIFTRNDVHTRTCDVGDFCLDVNFEAAAIYIDSLKIIVVSLYHSPSGNPQVFLQNFDKLLSFLASCSSYTSVIGGDFNYNFDITKTNNMSKQFCNIMRQYDFYYLNNKATRGVNCLDNVLVNSPRKIQIDCEIFNFPFSDHNGLKVCAPFGSLKKGKRQSAKTSLDSVGYYKLIVPNNKLTYLTDKLKTYQWDNILNMQNPTALGVFQVFFKTLINNINYFSKLKKVNQNHCAKLKHNWYTNDLADIKKGYYS